GGVVDPDRDRAHRRTVAAREALGEVQLVALEQMDAEVVARRERVVCIGRHPDRRPGTDLRHQSYHQRRAGPGARDRRERALGAVELPSDRGRLRGCGRSTHRVHGEHRWGRQRERVGHLCVDEGAAGCRPQPAAEHLSRLPHPERGEAGRGRGAAARGGRGPRERLQRLRRDRRGRRCADPRRRARHPAWHAAHPHGGPCW
ncbi:MAG: hypothetical protein M1823_006813, partial [Watsoniomyces obsoletus]